MKRLVTIAELVDASFATIADTPWGKLPPMRPAVTCHSIGRPRHYWDPTPGYYYPSSTRLPPGAWMPDCPLRLPEDYKDYLYERETPEDPPFDRPGHHTYWQNRYHVTRD